MDERHRVIIVGCGFGGLSAAQRLKDVDAGVTLIDRRNHHLFQPLLYQVAMSVLSTADIAWPIRHLFKDRKNIRTILGEVVGVDTQRREVDLASGATLGYDTLVLATGSTHAYFGHDEWAVHAPGLKTLEDATTIRRRILLAFEQAELDPDPDRRRALLTFTIIGGGPTGVELAGTIAELARETLRGEFSRFSVDEVRVVLVEAAPRILSGFSEKMAGYAERKLESLGVEVWKGQPVSECGPKGVTVGEKMLESRTLVWAAGVEASPAAKWISAPADKAGRVEVEPDLSVPGHPEIFVIGDTASVSMPNGDPVPGLAPAAKQQGTFVGDLLRARLTGGTEPERFVYHHRGSLATVGERDAVVEMGWFKLKGRLAWLLWGVAHIYFLIGTRSRFTVALSWFWTYLFSRRSARLITQRDALSGKPPEGEETRAVDEAPPGAQVSEVTR
ncbi:NAD(P)/FAD-dependent oxidoreductase [Pararhizobium mangrovi]|uniref:NADH:ubiquinone reductase (non-electrogenic) n=1 Tax=Pararhizobium mangrovi TaxID=2590452 RepID=A0A506UI49_9HYPH|nr:NAD(P)/FAD-dependent oxidoreductase [Pararhizobium mangrovi]